MQIYTAKHSLLAAADRPIYMYEYGTSFTLLVRQTKLNLSLVGFIILKNTVVTVKELEGLPLQSAYMTYCIVKNCSLS